MNQIYRTIDHPDGWSRAPDYEIHEDGKIYRTISHRDGVSLVADYDIRGDYLYPTSANSGHETTAPEFQIKLDGKIHRTGGHLFDSGGPAVYEFR